MTSRKNYKKKNNHSKKHRFYCCETTFSGLQEWYNHKFEKLGWMILAKDKGMNDKIMEYIHSVNRLEESIQYKLKNTKDVDRKYDLNIMLHNVGVLKQHIHTDFE